jgi:hypothetical protein
LRQTCCDPLVLLPAARGRVYAQVRGLRGDHRGPARVALRAATGDTRDRATPVRRFQAREVPLFLINLEFNKPSYP